MKRIVISVFIILLLLYATSISTAAAVNPPSVLDSFSADTASQWTREADINNGANLAATSDSGYISNGMRFDFTISGWGALITKRTDTKDNWSTYDGISFYAKGVSGQKITIRFYEAGSGSDYFTKQFTLSSTWQNYNIPFTEFSTVQGTNGDGVLDLTNVYRYGFQPNGAGSGSFYIDEIMLTSSEECLIITDVCTDKIGSVFMSEQPTAHLSVYNNYKTTENMEISYTVRDLYDNTVISDSILIENIPSGGSALEEIPLNLTKYGYYTIIFTYDSIDTMCRFSYIEAITAEILNQTDNRFGFCTHFDQLRGNNIYETIENEFYLISMSGCNFIRQDIIWEIIEPEKGVFDWALYDFIVERAEYYGVELEFTLCYSAKWASSAPVGVSNREQYPPVNNIDFANFVYQVVNRYKESVKNWEMWNEPNLNTFWRPEANVAAYSELMRAGYTAAKSADPTAIVGSGGMSGLGRPFFTELKRLGTMSYMDVLIIHPYQTGQKDPDENKNLENDLRDLYNIENGKDLWVTEWGWNVEREAQPVTLRQQAEYTAKGYIIKNAMAINKIGIYSFNILTDKGYGINSSARGGTTRPVYGAISGLIKTLDGREYSGNMDSGDIRIFTYKKEGEVPFLAVWASSNKTINLTASGNVTEYDIFGNEIAILTPVSGNIQLNLTPSPIYLIGDFDISSAKKLYVKPQKTGRLNGARFNFQTHFDGDVITSLDSIGGGWSTSLSGIRAEGLENTGCAKYTFVTKIGGNINAASEYGFKFPTGDSWSPMSGVIEKLSDALIDSEAVSFYFKTNASNIDRQAIFQLQTKNSEGVTSGNYYSPSISLNNDGSWQLIYIPLRDFRLSGGSRFTRLSESDLQTTDIPYKFAVNLTYRNFLGLTASPTVVSDPQTIWLDNFMIERKIDHEKECIYPISVPLDAESIQYNSNEIAGISDGTIDFSKNPVLVRANGNAEFITAYPPMLTSGNTQYKSGSYVIKLSENKIRAISGNFLDFTDYDIEKIPLHQTCKLVLTNEMLINGQNTLNFETHFFEANPSPILYVILRDKETKILHDLKIVPLTDNPQPVLLNYSENCEIKAFVWNASYKPLSNIVRRTYEEN